MCQISHHPPESPAHPRQLCLKEKEGRQGTVIVYLSHPHFSKLGRPLPHSSGPLLESVQDITQQLCPLARVGVDSAYAGELASYSSAWSSARSSYKEERDPVSISGELLLMSLRWSDLMWNLFPFTSVYWFLVQQHFSVHACLQQAQLARDAPVLGWVVSAYLLRNFQWVSGLITTGFQDSRVWFFRQHRYHSEFFLSMGNGVFDGILINETLEERDFNSWKLFSFIYPW